MTITTALAVIMLLTLVGGLAAMIAADLLGDVEPPSTTGPRHVLGMTSAVVLIATGCAANPVPRTRTVVPVTDVESTDTRTTSAPTTTTTTTVVRLLVDPNGWYEALYEAEAATSTTAPEPATTAAPEPATPEPDTTVEPPEPIIAFAPTVEHAETGGGASAICAADAVSCVDHQAIGTTHTWSCEGTFHGGGYRKASDRLIEWLDASVIPVSHRLAACLISLAESNGDNNAIGHNSNGSFDVCLLQLNSGNFAWMRRNGFNPDVFRTDPLHCLAAGWAWAQITGPVGLEFCGQGQWSTITMATRNAPPGTPGLC